jgi:uncharacterized protein (DUF362 family)
VSHPRVRVAFHPVSRRRFLQLLGLAGIAAAEAGCQPAHPSEPPTATATATAPTAAAPTTAAAVPTRTPLRTATATAEPAATATAASTPAPTATPPPSPTRAPADTPTRTPTSAPSETPTPAAKATVATGQASSYDLPLLRQELARMLDSLGGLSRWIQPGASVGIKTNLTGGTWYDDPSRPPAIELYATHPAVVRVIGEMALAAGAGRLVIVDGLGDPASFEAWGYAAVAGALSAELIDLCVPAPYPGFQSFPVGAAARVYGEFSLNPILGALDVFVSVAKLKCHYTAGVTLSMKNLIGLAPTSLYRRSPEDNNRSAFHDTEIFDRRIPRIVLDLLQVRPIHLAVIDGIFTAEGGAGPWDAGLSQVRPGVLVAGGNPVATDAVATAVMGFDPNAAPGSSPFLHGDNHLALAHDYGFGTNLLDEIRVVGPRIEDIRYPFHPAM